MRSALFLFTLVACQRDVPAPANKTVPRSAVVAEARAISEASGRDLVVGVGHLYWLEETMTSAPDSSGRLHKRRRNELRRASKNGGAVETVAVLERSPHRISAITSRHAYLFESGPRSSRGIRRVDLASGEQSVIEDPVITRATWLSSAARQGADVYLFAGETDKSRGGLTHFLRIDEAGRVQVLRTDQTGSAQISDLSRLGRDFIATRGGASFLVNRSGRRYPLPHLIQRLATQASNEERVAFATWGGARETVVSVSGDGLVSTHNSVEPLRAPFSPSSDGIHRTNKGIRFRAPRVSARGMAWTRDHLEIHDSGIVCGSCTPTEVPLFQILKVQAWDGEAKEVARGKIGSFAIDDAFVYWFDLEEEKLMRRAI